MELESGAADEAVGRSLIRLTAELRDKDVLTQEEAEDVLDPINEYVDQFKADEDKSTS